MYIDPDLPEYWVQGVWVPEHYPESGFILNLYTNIPYLDYAINAWIKWQMGDVGARWKGDAYGQIFGEVDGRKACFRTRHRYWFEDKHRALEVLDRFGHKWEYHDPFKNE